MTRDTAFLWGKLFLPGLWPIPGRRGDRARVGACGPGNGVTGRRERLGADPPPRPGYHGASFPKSSQTRAENSPISSADHSGALRRAQHWPQEGKITWRDVPATHWGPGSVPREQGMALSYPGLPNLTDRKQGGLFGDVASLSLRILTCKLRVVIPAGSQVVMRGRWHTQALGTACGTQPVLSKP